MPQIRKKFLSNYDELEYLIELLTHQFYVQKAARGRLARYENRLERLLEVIPTEPKSLLQAEARSILHEMRSQFEDALASRYKESELVEELYADIDRNRYDPDVRRVLMRRWGKNENELRKRVITGLRRKLDSNRNLRSS
ncbi:hypothetical protein GC207_15495 [bacterium]|nr:hypothetical protein [bacterium]